jgi:hypothetical protein
VPLELYHFFIDKFADAIRVEIARSAERSYESIAIKDMQKMFMIEKQDQLMEFIQSNDGKDGIAWSVRGDRVAFIKKKQEMNEIPSLRMIDTALSYATELNRII